MFRFIAISVLTVVIGAQAFAQNVAGSSTVTLSAGGETSLGTAFVRSGPAFNAGYEFRLSKHFAVDAGQETWLPAGYSSQLAPVFSGISPLAFNPVSTAPTPGAFALVPVPTRRVSIASHVTGRALLPLAHDRVELFLGAGAGYAWNLAGSPLPSGFVVEFETGGRFAIDKRKRFWLGASSQFFGNFSANRQQWFATTADVGFRFGR